MQNVKIYYLHKGDNIPFYIGKTNHLEARLKNHKKKYGDIEIKVIKEVKDWKKWERYYIKKYKNLGYQLENKNSGGGGPSKGRIVTEETKIKLRGKRKNTKNMKEPKSQSHVKNMKGKHLKPIIQYDLKGNFIKKWEGSIKVKEELGWNLGSCLRGKSKTCKGFIWRRIDNPLPKNFNSNKYLVKKDKGSKKPQTKEHKLNISKGLNGRKNTWHYTKINQLDLQGKFIKQYDSIVSAKKEGINGDISSCLRKKQKTAGGFKWEYVY